MISNLIHIFLNDFKYLNSKGKRAGFMLFSNDKLTSDLEKEALRITNVLKALAQNRSISDETKLEHFNAAIRECFENVKNLRKTHAPVETVLAYASFDNDPYTIGYTRNKRQRPYAPSKFEEEIVKGLKAALGEAEEERLKFVADEVILTSFIDKCTKLKSEISNYSPEDIIVERGTKVERGDPFPFYGPMM
jgi:hypothetical protein